MSDWVVKNAAKLLMIAVAVVVILGVLVVKSCSDAREASTREKLATGQTGAVVESGRDAVATVGNRADAETKNRETVEETKDEIERAQDAGAVTDAGLAGLRNVHNRRQPK